jgi:predicted O-linked N-acetylglucosamine transferase (SPINDLY family)
LEGAFEHFVDAGEWSDREVAEHLAGAGIDIAVDLTGYTHDARTEILAHRPAPIQVNYLGYPGTLGVDFMDYVLVDGFVVPEDQQEFFTERLVRLPDCYLPSGGFREVASRTPMRSECGLPESGFVYCCFNNSNKLTPEVLVSG